MRKHIPTILFFGGLWGLLEASLGYVLHWVPALISGSVMFPIAGLLLYKTYSATNSKASLVFTAGIAAAIKSINFLMPNLSQWKVINPMVSIMLESLVLVIVVEALGKEGFLPKLLGFSLASFSWRILFLGWQGFQFMLTKSIPPLLLSLSSMASFVLLSGAIGAAIAIGLFMLSQSWWKRPLQLAKQPLWATLSVILAIGTTIGVYFL